jgi:transcriptional regulator with XRE-family HTH domain
MDFVNQLFGKRLKEIREASGLKQREVADAVGVETPTVSRWETGEFLPDDHKLKALCKALKKDPQDFFMPTALQIESIRLRPKPEDFTNSRDAIGAAAAFLAKFASLPPPFQRAVLALVYKDTSYVQDLSDRPGRALQTLLSSL